MFDHVPTVRARHLGWELNRAMQKTGRNASDMAGELGWSPSKVSRVLSGKRAPNAADVSAFLALCGVTGQRRRELMSLASSDLYAPFWWQDHGGCLPIHRPVLTNLEEAAIAITCFGGVFVPDLLHTPNYTRALLRSWPAMQTGDEDEAGEIDERVAETTRRQHILDRPYAPPTLRVFLDEYSISRTGAGDEVMSDQAHHLLRMAVRPNVHIQVVPDASGIDDINPFTVLEFADLPSVLCLETPTAAAFAERDETIAAYQRVVADLDRRALDETATRTWLRDIARQRARVPDARTGIFDAGG